MQKKYGKGTQEFNFFMEFWQLLQKYAEPDGIDSFWDEAIHSFSALQEKYKDVFFTKNIIVGYMDALSDRSKAGKVK